MTESAIPERHALAVTVFSDYVCPFCYVADRRLARLGEQFDLEVTWRPIEIHPNTPPEGMPLADLGYPRDLWDKMMTHLVNMAAEEKIVLGERTHTYNSHKALLLSESARDAGGDTFTRLHGALFHAYLGQGKNISDIDILRAIATDAGMDEATFERALIEPEYENRLRENYVAARRHGVTGVPAFLIGDKVIAGAVPLNTLITAAQEAAMAAP
ncbi:MAG: DsbA family protein [Leptospirillia bacterium]